MIYKLFSSWKSSGFQELSTEQINELFKQAESYRKIVKHRENVSLRETQVQLMLKGSLLIYDVFYRERINLWAYFGQWLTILSFTLSLLSLFNVIKTVKTSFLFSWTKKKKFSSIIYKINVSVMTAVKKVRWFNIFLEAIYL